MSTITAPDFGIKAINWMIDRPSQSNVSAWTGKRRVSNSPWHAKWTAHVDLAAIQGEDKFRLIRSFIARCRGSANTFILYATAGAQNSNSGVTVAADAAAGATTISISGATAPLLEGQMFTVNSQLCICTSDQSGSALTFEPQLRRAATAGAAVETSRPWALVYMTNSSLGWSIGDWRMFGVSFDVEEEIDPSAILLLETSGAVALE